MAHTITGIDLGSWSVKFSVFDVGFRRVRLHASFEEIVPPGEAPLAERQAEALRAGVARLPSQSTIHMALPGEMLALRVLDLPFSDARKVDQVVGYELEGQIMYDLSEVVMDHVILSAAKTGESEPAGSRALAVAARSEAVAAFLASLKQCGVEPRTLYPTPIVYHALLAEERAPAETAPTGVRLFIDVGHQRSQLCFLRGDEAVFGRTGSHAGEELTLALVRASGDKWTWAQAEQAKQMHGCVPSRARPPATSAQRQLGAVLQEALAPFLRDLRQTLASFRAQNKEPVQTILLAGGGSRLQGLAEGRASRAFRRSCRKNWAFLPACGQPRLLPRLQRGSTRSKQFPWSTKRDPANAHAWPCLRPWPGPGRTVTGSWTCGAVPSSTAPTSRSCARRLLTWRFWSGLCWPVPPWTEPSRSGACPASSSNSKRD